MLAICMHMFVPVVMAKHFCCCLVSSSSVLMNSRRKKKSRVWTIPKSGGLEMKMKMLLRHHRGHF